MSKFLAALAGLLLVAPAAHATLNIASGATKHVSCVANTCTATDKSAVLNASELSAMLAGADIVVKADGDAQTIGITAAFSWASGHVLTLTAQHDVIVKAQVVVEGVGGVRVNTTGDGDLKFSPGGRIDFWDTAASFALRGTNYGLVNDIAGIASAYASDENANVALAKDYDAGPDGTYTNAAAGGQAGSFEGLGHTVSNFSATGTNTGQFVGFFAQSSGTIRDVTLSNAQVTSNLKKPSESHQAFAGVLGSGSGTIIGVHTSGTVTAPDWSKAGGLSGAGSAVTRSDSSVAVTCAKHCHAGGLVGYGGSFLLSHASGPVTVGAHSVGGGLTALLYVNGTVAQSFATGDLASAGNNDPVILGGLVGEAIEDTSITDSYALGAVRNEGASQLGGMLGFGGSNIVRNTYTTGVVGHDNSARSSWLGTGAYIGFANAIDRADYTNDYWDTDTSPLTKGCGAGRHGGCPALTRLRDRHLKDQLPAGFDPTIWGQNPSINNGYPYLLGNPPG